MLKGSYAAFGELRFHVCFGSLADIRPFIRSPRQRATHQRYELAPPHCRPRGSGSYQTQIASRKGRAQVSADVRLVPRADIAPIANECDACGNVYLPPLRTGRNRGSHCTNRDCLPAQSAGIVQSNYIDSPSTRFLCCSVSRRTKGVRRRRPVADKRSAW